MDYISTYKKGKKKQTADYLELETHKTAHLLLT